MSDTVHVPVLLQETVDGLNVQPGGVYFDGTLGGGGHTKAVIAKLAEQNGTVIGNDRDLAAVDRTEMYLKNVFSGIIGKNVNVHFVHADYRFFDEALDLLHIDKLDGFLLDLGLSSDQIADRSRGFSFDSDGPLDLRFDTSEGETAAEMLKRLPEKEIADLIYKYGEEKLSRNIAKRIKLAEPLAAKELAGLVRKCYYAHGFKSYKIDPATRTFQALRIAVNRELDALETTLKMLPKRMKHGGRVAVIAFHSLEDRIVKNCLREDEHWKILTKKPVIASDAEVERNPRSRSAKLRVAEYVKIK